MNLNAQLGVGGFAGDPDSTTPFPADYNLDYIRVYSKDQVLPPLIFDQLPLQTEFETPIDLSMADLEVWDHYQVYPEGFQVFFNGGKHYSMNGNLLRPDQGYSGWLSVPAKVYDGIDTSQVFNLKIHVLSDGQTSLPDEEPFLVFLNPLSFTSLLKTMNCSE